MMRKVSYGKLYNLLQYSKKLFFYGVTIGVVSSCQNPKSFIKNMQGTWSGPTSGEGMSYEQWNPADLADEAFGYAWIMEEGDTVFKEKFVLIKRESGYAYWAYPNMTSSPTIFELKKSRANYLEVVNLQHDFPQVIIYQLDKDRVKITLKGKGEVKEQIEESYTLSRQSH